ncbi:MAG: M20/M25/M40 family metallo-hydrolase [Bacteroidales bacterium]|nr:M20/M25/M40 family metallo-hydrolase [Bacteroidales bacterium]
MKANMTDLLCRLTGTPSVSGSEDKTATLLTDYLNAISKVRAERIGNNVIARKESYVAGFPTVLLCSHHDTVAPAAGYTRDPFVPVIEKDAEGRTRLYGLGSNDAGGAVVSMIHAFCDLEDLPFNLLLILAAGEETSAPEGIASVLPNFPGISCAIVGEPTGLQAAVGEKGLLVLDGYTTGHSGHAARNDGVNALYAALDDIAILRDFRFKKVSGVMGPVHLQVTQIKAGEQHNVIPAACHYVVDIRTTDAYSNKQIVEMLGKAVSGQFVPRNLANKASMTPLGHPLLDAVNKTGLRTYISPTTSDWMRLPCPAIKLGPGDSLRSHVPNEFIYVSELQQGAEIYKKVLSLLKL